MARDEPKIFCVRGRMEDPLGGNSLQGLKPNIQRHGGEITIRREEPSLVIDQIDPRVGCPLNHTTGTVEDTELDTVSNIKLSRNAFHRLNGQAPMVKAP